MSRSNWHPLGGNEQPWIYHLDDMPSPDRNLRTMDSGTRNGMPEPGGYHWNVRGRAREAEVAAELAAIRACIRQEEGPA